MIIKILLYLKTHIKAVFAVVLLLCGVSFVLFSDYGIVRRIELQVEISEQTDKYEKLRAEQDSLNYQIYLLQNDYYEIERIAREYYGMIKPNEKIYIISEPEVKDKE